MPGGTSRGEWLVNGLALAIRYCAAAFAVSIGQMVAVRAKIGTVEHDGKDRIIRETELFNFRHSVFSVGNRP